MKTHYVGTIDERGRIDDDTFYRIVGDFNRRENQTVLVTIDKFSKSASDQQRKYWRAVVVPTVANHCGYTDDEAHENLLFELMPELRRTTKRFDGSDGSARVSWNDLSTAQATQLIERAFVFCSTELELYIPAPGEWIK